MAVPKIVMDTWNHVRGIKQDYVRTFQRESVPAQRVLQDLARFCRATETVYHEDKKMMYILIGRNEVFRRVEDMLNLSVEDLYRLRTGQQLNLKEEETQDE